MKRFINRLSILTFAFTLFGFSQAAFADGWQLINGEYYYVIGQPRFTSSLGLSPVLIVAPSYKEYNMTAKDVASDFCRWYMGDSRSYAREIEVIQKPGATTSGVRCTGPYANSSCPYKFKIHPYGYHGEGYRYLGRVVCRYND